MCEVVNEPWEHDGKTYDGDYAGQQQVFTDQQILSSIGMANLFQGMADETDQFQASLKVGDIIHYDNGFNQFVRCEIALKDGKTYAQPIALVGEWHSHDLPRRYEDGTVYNGYHADQILNPDKERSGTKEHWFPNASSTYESPSYHRKAKSIDPRNLDPIDLTLAEMDEGEAELARVWQIVKSVKAALESAAFTTPQGKLTEAKRILDDEVW